MNKQFDLSRYLSTFFILISFVCNQTTLEETPTVPVPTTPRIDTTTHATNQKFLNITNALKITTNGVTLRPTTKAPTHAPANIPTTQKPKSSTIKTTPTIPVPIATSTVQPKVTNSTTSAPNVTTHAKPAMTTKVTTNATTPEPTRFPTQPTTPEPAKVTINDTTNDPTWFQTRTPTTEPTKVTTNDTTNDPTWFQTRTPTTEPTKVTTNATTPDPTRFTTHTTTILTVNNTTPLTNHSTNSTEPIPGFVNKTVSITNVTTLLTTTVTITTTTEFRTTKPLTTPEPTKTTTPTTPTPTPTPNTTPKLITIEDITNKTANILEHLNETTTIANMTKEDWHDNLSSINDIVYAAATNDAIDFTEAVNVTSKTFQIASKLIEVPHVWNNFSQTEKLESASNMFHLFKNISQMLNAKQAYNNNPNQPSSSSTSYSAKYGPIEVQSKKFVASQLNDSMVFAFEKQSVELPLQSLIGTEVDPTLNNPTNQHVATTVVVAIFDMLSNVTAESSSGISFINSQVISVTVGNHNGTIQLKPPHKFKYTSKNLNRLEFMDKPKCTFWDFHRTNWSTVGCIPNRLESNRSHTVCECDHLTNFAALMDIAHREGPSQWKTIFTNTFSGLNCVFILLAVYVALKHNRRHYAVAEDRDKKMANQYSLTLNIAGCLLVSHVLIVFGMDLTEHPTLCSLNSIILLFGLLSTFVFMFLLSFHHLMVGNSFFISKAIDFKYYALIGFTLPLVIILISFVTIWVSAESTDWFHSMRGEYFCWISSVKYPKHIWIFVIPATLILVSNFTILIYLITVVFIKIKNVKHSKFKGILNSHESRSDQWKKLLTNSYFLAFNFGIPWILYVFYINEYFRNFAYLFIFLNGTQGIALFVEQVYIYKIAKQRRSSYRLGSRKRSE